MFWDKKITIATHSGNFHPDDVFSVAVLSMIFKGKVKVIRSRDPEVYSKADFVIDIGFEHNPETNRYDHHQEGGPGARPNGIKYSSVGLLWKKYGVEVCGSEKIAKIIDGRLIQLIDAEDEKVDLYDFKIKDVKPFPLIDFIYDLTPTWKDRFSLNEAFTKAVDFAKEVLGREIKLEKDEEEARNIVEKAYLNSSDKRIIILDNPYLPKSILMEYPEPIFVIKPEKDGPYWRVGTLDKEKFSYDHGVRKNFPENWWGKKKKELAEITGVDDVVFCRNGGIFAGAKSKEGAIKMAQIALEK